MSAPRRTAQNRPVWLEPHRIGDPPRSFREKVLDYLEAKASLEKIMGPGLNEEFIWKWLWQLAHRADDGKPQASQWYRLPQQKLHTLRRLPKKVRGWAKTIKNVSLKMEANYAYSRTASSLTAFLESQ